MLSPLTRKHLPPRRTLRSAFERNRVWVDFGPSAWFPRGKAVGLGLRDLQGERCVKPRLAGDWRCHPAGSREVLSFVAACRDEFLGGAGGGRGWEMRSLSSPCTFLLFFFFFFKSLRSKIQRRVCSVLALAWQDSQGSSKDDCCADVLPYILEPGDLNEEF